MSVLRTILFVLVFYAGSLPFVIAAFLGVYLSRPLLSAAARGWSYYHRLCAHLLLGIRVKIVGDISSRPVIFAVKHESFFETIDMPYLFRQPAVVAKKQLFSIPFWGSAGIAYGMIPVDREAGATALRQMIALAKSLNAEGRPIVICPEGTRAKRGERPPLQSGFAGLYKLLGLPVVPIAHDSGRLGPKESLWWRSGTITYLVGEEIPPGLPRDEMENRVHKAINALNN